MVNGNSSASTTTTEKTAGETIIPDGNANTILFPTLPDKNQFPLADDTVSRMDADGRFVYKYIEVGPNTTTVTLKNLKHFSAYTIHVKACRYGIEDNCSVETSTPARTKKLGECFWAPQTIL